MRHRIAWNRWLSSALITLAAGTVGYITNSAALPLWLLLALPLGDLLGRVVLRSTGRDADELDQALAEAEELRTQLATSQRRERSAIVQAASASAGLVAAADLAAHNEEDVRALIVADLHDTVAQTLAAVAYMRFDPNATTSRLAELSSIAERELRDIMVAQRPVMGKMDSLAQTFTSLVSDMEVRRKIRVDVHWDPPEIQYPYPIAATLYRFAAEGLVNIAKHAGVMVCRLSLTRTGDELVLSISDDGVGFDTEKLATTERLGLSLLRSRAQMIDAHVDVESSPGRGTTLRLRIPMEYADPASVVPRSPSADDTADRPGRLRRAVAGMGVSRE